MYDDGATSRGYYERFKIQAGNTINSRKPAVKRTSKQKLNKTSHLKIYLH